MNLNDTIKNLPPSFAAPQKPQVSDPNQSLNNVMNFLTTQLHVNKTAQAIESMNSVSKDFKVLLGELSSLIAALDVEGFSDKVTQDVLSLKEAITGMEVNLTASDIQNLKSALQSIKFPEKVSLSNINLITSKLEALIQAVEQIPQAEKVEEVRLKGKALEYLKNLEKLSNDPESPLSVQLSDGKEFYKGVAEAVERGIFVGGGSTSSFVDTQGSPTKGQLDANGNVKVSVVAGTSNIGDVDVVTQPARSRTTDSISAALATDAIMNGTTALTPKFAVIDHAISGDNTVVAAVASKKIRVVSLFLVSAGTVNARFESGASGTALTGQMNLVANTGFVLPYNPVGWFETTSGALLNLELSAAVSVDGSLTYIEV